MTGDRFPDGFETAVNRVRDGSDQALYPYLNVGILGAYEGDCHAYLNELRLSLRDLGFEQVKLASDRDSNVPNSISESQYWYEDSVKFLEECDVVIFVFFTNEVRRPYLPERAFQRDPTDRTNASQGINNSIVVELDEWIDLVPDPEESTFVIYEEPCHQDASSLIEGKINYTGIDDRVIDPHIVDQSINAAKSKCANWAMGRFRNRLQDRYITDR
ncbi:hypothetical protein [Natronorubrum sp. FCH18a]|uniref:hypothetical protein n=1 Tax=Natronorubrum sp. FCH18a TaxID=3447018 RepID=UPI003F516EFB